MTAIHWTDKLAIQCAMSVKARSSREIGSVRLREAARFVLFLAGAFALVSVIVGVRLYAFFPPL